MQEADIRPADLLKQYLALSAKDAEQLFNDVVRTDIPCVACCSSEVEPQFVKHSFGFAKCSSCRTLYQTPRPEIAAFGKFYKDSVSSDFWANEFFPAVMESRREKILRPRAEAVADILAARDFKAQTLVDVGAGHGVFLQALVDAIPGSQGIAVEPSEAMANSCREAGFAVHQALAEEVTDLSDAADLTCALEVMEHVHDPLDFLTRLVEFTRPGGMVFFTTLGADGFDLQILGEEANAVSPPHHLNFMSVNGFHALCSRAGLVDVEVTTPGKLDVDIVRNRFADLPALKASHPFFAALLEDKDASEAFQTFLADHQRSSHTWVLARKPEA